jgi:hypothetical protein
LWRPEGREPDRRLFAKDNVSKFSNFEISSGIDPVSWFSERDKTCSAVSDPKERGIEPVNRLPRRDNFLSSVRQPISGGICPTKAFSWRKSVRIFLNRLKERKEGERDREVKRGRGRSEHWPNFIRDGTSELIAIQAEVLEVDHAEEGRREIATEAIIKTIQLAERGEIAQLLWQLSTQHTTVDIQP